MKTDLREAHLMMSDADAAKMKGGAKAKLVAELSNGYQASTELKSTTRALRGFLAEVVDDYQLQFDAERELETLIDWVECIEYQLVCILDGMRVQLGLKLEDLPAARFKLKP